MTNEATAKLAESITKSIDSLIQETDAVKQSETFKKWLNTLAAFHEYSFGNVMLIAMQKQDATKVAGFHTWHKLGRHVRKGEKAIRILAPLVVKDKEANDGSKRVVGFRNVCVFDISQTEGEDISCGFEQLSSGNAGDLKIKLEAFAASQNIAVEYTDTRSNGAYGLSYGGRIAIDSSIDVSAQVGVLIHELAHELLQHAKTRKETTKEQRELEAESVAYAVLTHFGMQANSSFYLASYGITSEMLKASMNVIGTTSKTIIQAISGKIEESEDVAA